MCLTHFRPVRLATFGLATLQVKNLVNAISRDRREWTPTASTEEYSPGIEHSAEASLVNAYTIDWCATFLANTVTSEPMSSYQQELRRQMKILYGTVDRTSVALPIDVAPAVEAHSADNFAYATAQSADAYMHRYPALLPNMVASWPTFEIELQREMDALYGIINSNEAKVVGALVPSSVLYTYGRRIGNANGRSTCTYSHDTAPPDLGDGTLSVD
ncbi:hypothetical protein JVT61DRAFT_871 [Boletus reticuloceps]|uniref:Uncharacterized protein n=1 Tax=Boletus reticuloceps TaxID=495285 RepID=A0A8I2YT24_9AGAM|nr:hypothetical protein JVT61DRAFT_871 [Boletus reticuloceps]